MTQTHIRRSLPTAATIVEVHTDNYRTRTLVLDARLDAVPGQFVMAWLPRFDEKPFSLVNHDPVTLMITAVGPFSRQVYQLRPGDRLWLRGPYGCGYEVPASHRHIALVGGGYGVAPLYWLARTQLARGLRVETVIGARTQDDLLYLPRFSTLDPEHHTLHVATEDGLQGLAGRVTDALVPILATGQIDGIYGCGPHGMLAALAQQGDALGVSHQLSWEAYMRCAVGICGACEHDGQLLCLDGPVLGREPLLPANWHKVE